MMSVALINQKLSLPTLTSDPHFCRLQLHQS